MTGIRQSFVFALEKGFGEGPGTGAGAYSWLVPPPGSFFEGTPNRQTNDIYGAGDKFRQNVAYGQFSGTWSWTFMLDYNYLEPFMLAFEVVNSKSVGDNGFGGYNGTTFFTFEKKNYKRVPSFCVRQKKLNQIVGGTSTKDELIEYYGCVVQQISFNRSASSAQYQISMSGIYVDEAETIGTLAALDYPSGGYSPKLVEYSCVFQGDGVADGNYVANTESLSMTIGNNAAAVYNVCTPFATAYFEGKSQFQFSTTMYSWNPEIWRLRANSGGKDNTHLKPAAKNLAPMGTITVASYDKSKRDDNLGTMTAAYNGSDNHVKFTIKDAVIKGIKRPSGDGSKIVDTVSSASCSSIKIEIKSANYSNNGSLLTKNTITSNAITTT